MNHALLVHQLIEEETRNNRTPDLFPYDDANVPLTPAGNITIGVGHNLTANGLTLAQCLAILDDDIAEILPQIQARWPWWNDLDDVRQRVIVDMAFNLGVEGLAGFPNTLAFCKDENWPAAANELRADKWYAQDGRRSRRLVAMLETGQDNDINAF